MREHSSLPPEQPGPSAESAEGAAAVPDPAGRQASTDSMDFSPPPAAPVTDQTFAGRWRQRWLWLILALVILATAAAAAALARKWQADQALRQVARALALPGAAPAQVVPAEKARLAEASGNGPAPAGEPGATVVSPDAALPATATQQTRAGPPATPQKDIASGSAPGQGGRLDADSPEGTVAPIAADRASAVAGADAGAQPPQRDRAARNSEKGSGVAQTGAAKGVSNGTPRGTAKATAKETSKGKPAGTSREASKRAVRAGSGTFKRCPPLGTKGAVMCRWHICNGGAGKEPACRPYLERRP